MILVRRPSESYSIPRRIIGFPVVRLRPRPTARIYIREPIQSGPRHHPFVLLRRSPKNQRFRACRKLDRFGESLKHLASCSLNSTRRPTPAKIGPPALERDVRRFAERLSTNRAQNEALEPRFCATLNYKTSRIIEDLAEACESRTHHSAR